jgi:hypothetical protein
MSIINHDDLLDRMNIMVMNRSMSIKDVDSNVLSVVYPFGGEVDSCSTVDHDETLKVSIVFQLVQLFS